MTISDYFAAHPSALVFALVALGAFLGFVLFHLTIKRATACSDCCGSGKRHVCGMGACADFDEPCPACGGSGKPAA